MSVRLVYMIVMRMPDVLTLKAPSYAAATRATLVMEGVVNVSCEL